MRNARKPLEQSDIFIGVNAVDYSGYPDCRPEYIAAFETMANLATKTGVTKQTVLTIESKCKTANCRFALL